jgi:hypothetical protein
MTYAIKDLNKAAAAHDRAYALNDIRETLKLHPAGAYHDKLMAERDGLINEMALECVAEYKRRYK